MGTPEMIRGVADAFLRYRAVSHNRPFRAPRVCEGVCHRSFANTLWLARGATAQALQAALAVDRDIPAGVLTSLLAGGGEGAGRP